MTEEWKDIIGYEGLYVVSSLGNIKKIYKSGKSKLKKLSKDKDGYLVVRLSKNNVSRLLRVHRVVAQAFIDNPKNLPEVNHKNENKSNNIVTNLEWCTRRYNFLYGTRVSRTAKTQSKTIYQYTIDKKLIKKWVAAECVAAGFERSCIAKCCRGERRTHKGFIWSYEELE